MIFFFEKPIHNQRPLFVLSSKSLRVARLSRIRGDWDISIHPRGTGHDATYLGVTQRAIAVLLGLLLMLVISIHAPRAGRDPTTPRPVLPSQHFNPRAPNGMILGTPGFPSMRPVRGDNPRQRVPAKDSVFPSAHGKKLRYISI